MTITITDVAHAINNAPRRAVVRPSCKVFCTDTSKNDASARSRANALTVRIAPSVSPAREDASAAAVRVSLLS